MALEVACSCETDLTLEPGESTRCGECNRVWRCERLEGTNALAVWREVERCDHGIDLEDFCDLCAHHPVEEWCGHPVTICQRCIVPWPCEWSREHHLREEARPTT